MNGEAQLRKWADHYQKDIVILRVPGIYAVDRLPIERIKKGLPVLRQQDSPFTNRIHADDLASVCQIAMDKAQSGEVFNVTDGQPCSMTEYFDLVAEYAHLPQPPKVSLDEAQQVMSKGMLSYLNESRRISNQKLVKVLGVRFAYPSLRRCFESKPQN